MGLEGTSSNDFGFGFGKNKDKYKDLTEGEEPAVTIPEATKTILRRHSFVTLKENDLIYVCKDGVYLPEGEVVMKQVLEAARTQFTHLGWNVSVYVKDRRMHVQELVRDVCDIAFGIKRHQIGLMPKERAAMAFNGSLYAVSFDNLRRLMGLGTDVVVIEKEGPTMKLIPHTKNVWIALIESQGFLVEYAIALAELCNGNWATAQTYTFDGKHSWVPRNKGNIGIISDWDYSGCMIDLQVRGADRIGIDFNTKDELNAMFSYLDLRIEDLEEPVNDHGGKGSTQWRGLVNLYNNGENDKNKLSLDEWAFYREYLSQRRDGVTYLEYLKSNRIEINTVMSAVKPRRFWEWLQWKLQQIWPNRNYNRAMDLPNYYHTPTMKNFIKSYNSKVGLLIEKPRKEYEEEFNSVPGMFRDIDEFVFISEDDVPSREPRPDERFQFEDNTNTREREVEIDMVDNVLLNDEQIKNLDLAIEKLMKEHNLNSDSREDSTEYIN